MTDGSATSSWPKRPMSCTRECLRARKWPCDGRHTRHEVVTQPVGSSAVGECHASMCRDGQPSIGRRISRVIEGGHPVRVVVAEPVSGGPIREGQRRCWFTRPPVALTGDATAALPRSIGTPTRTAAVSRTVSAAELMPARLKTGPPTMGDGHPEIPEELRRNLDT